MKRLLLGLQGILIVPNLLTALCMAAVLLGATGAGFSSYSSGQIANEAPALTPGSDAVQHGLPSRDINVRVIADTRRLPQQIETGFGSGQEPPVASHAPAPTQEPVLRYALSGGGVEVSASCACAFNARAPPHRAV